MEDVAGVDLGLHVVQAWVVAVGDDGLREALELLQVVDDPAAEERAAVREGRLVDDDGGAPLLPKNVLPSSRVGS